MIAFIQRCEQLFNGWNPIVNGVTLASYILFVLKYEYIKHGDVGYIPENGYASDKNSKIAIKFLNWLKKKNPSMKIEHALTKNGEKKIKVNGRNYSVDGYDANSGEILEVHGCHWHGFPKCQPIRDRITPMTGGNTAQMLYDRTMRREEDLRNGGYTVNVVWECEIRRMLESDAEMRRFFELSKHTRRLMPRDALYGGRTQAFRSFVQEMTDILLQYYDYNSMYPYLNAEGTAYQRGNGKNSDGSFSYTVKMDEYMRYGLAAPLEGEMLRFRRGNNAFSEIWTFVMKKEIIPRMDKGHYRDGLLIPHGQLPEGTLIANDYPF